jgi:hypothetical protein
MFGAVEDDDDEAPSLGVTTTERLDMMAVENARPRPRPKEEEILS